MQIKFLTALILVGFCFVKVTFAHPQETRVQSILIGDLTSVAKNLIEEMQSVIKQRIDDASKNFNKFKDQVIDVAQAAIEDAKKNISEVIASSQKQIDAIIQKAKKVGADISACLTDSEDRFKELYIKFVQNEVSCITKEVDEATRVINGAIQIANDGWNIVEDVPKKLLACGIGISSFKCITRLITDVTALQVKLLDEISKKVTEVSEFVLGLQNRVEICAVSQVAKAGIEAAGVVADVTNCAAHQFGNEKKTENNCSEKL